MVTQKINNRPSRAFPARVVKAKKHFHCPVKIQKTDAAQHPFSVGILNYVC
jgi:hypothetical protein